MNFISVSNDRTNGETSNIGRIEVMNDRTTLATCGELSGMNESDGNNNSCKENKFISLL